MSIHGILVNDIVALKGLTLKDFYIEINSLNVYRRTDEFHCTMHILYYVTPQKLNGPFISEHKNFVVDNLNNLVTRLLTQLASDAGYKKYEII